ncbi:hypothetical protein NX059_012094 [Plenodomus lindquistii]|nr:hypothetical protein NX059_012094 [Plenodomus lindquistii]
MKNGNTSCEIADATQAPPPANPRYRYVQLRPEASATDNRGGCFEFNDASAITHGRISMSQLGIAGEQDNLLLKLPGELRNRIYDFCSEGRVVKLYRSGTKRGNRNSYHALTQVNRQLRHEFRPLYLERTSVQICHGSGDPKCYIEDMFNPRAPLTTRDDHPGNLIFPINHDGPFANENPAEVFKIALCYPKVQLRFQASMDAPDHFPVGIQQLNSLVQAVSSGSSPRMKAMMAEAVREVKLRVCSPFIKVGFVMTHEMADKYKSALRTWWETEGHPVQAIRMIGVYSYDPNYGDFPRAFEVNAWDDLYIKTVKADFWCSKIPMIDFGG